MSGAPEGLDSDDFKAMRKANQAQRAKQREDGPAALIKAGIAFVSHNSGAHITIGNRFDFWPGTMKWKARVGKKHGVGVRSLIKAVRS